MARRTFGQFFRAIFTTNSSSIKNVVLGSRSFCEAITLSFNLRAIFPPFAEAPSVPPPACKQCNIRGYWNNPEACRYLAATMGLT